MAYCRKSGSNVFDTQEHSWEEEQMAVFESIFQEMGLEIVQGEHNNHNEFVAEFIVRVPKMENEYMMFVFHHFEAKALNSFMCDVYHGWICESGEYIVQRLHWPYDDRYVDGGKVVGFYSYFVYEHFGSYFGVHKKSKMLECVCGRGNNILLRNFKERLKWGMKGFVS